MNWTYYVGAHVTTVWAVAHCVDKTSANPTFWARLSPNPQIWPLGGRARDLTRDRSEARADLFQVLEDNLRMEKGSRLAAAPVRSEIRWI
jgi:hypothetical protein